MKKVLIVSAAIVVVDLVTCLEGFAALVEHYEVVVFV